MPFRKNIPIGLIVLILNCCAAFGHNRAADDNRDCNNQVIFHEDFGSGAVNPGPELPPGTTTYCYEDLTGTCPSHPNLTPGTIFDGSYSIMNDPLTGLVSVDGILGGWISTEDHTPIDTNGYMLVVNADYEPGEFYRLNDIPVLLGETYAFSAWFANILGDSSIVACGPIQTPINIRFMVEDAASGDSLGSYTTGDMFATGEPLWLETVFNFNAESPKINIVLVNNSPGGCGNDFVIDDIELIGCSANGTLAEDDAFEMRSCDTLYRELLTNDMDPEADRQQVAGFLYDMDGDGFPGTYGPTGESTVVSGLSGSGQAVPQAAAVLLLPDGSLEVYPIGGFNGTIALDYIVCDDGIPTACDTAGITIIVDACNDICSIPDVITPNGDGINDYLVLECADGYNGLQLMVYNRWGNMVFDSGPGYDNTWQGTYGRANKELPEGTYFYIVQFRDQGNTSQAGDLTILR